MEILTKAYGRVNIDEENIITFEDGLIGFEEQKKFVILSGNEGDILLWLQSVEKEDLAFPVIQPRFFKKEYQPGISIAELKDLRVESEENLLLYAIVTVPKDVSKMTANLKAPIVINVQNNKGKQVVLNNESYDIKEPVFAKRD